MYAIIETGGKQYKVSEKDTISVEKVSKKEGDSLNIEKVLLISDKDDVKIGKPYLKSCSVKCKVLEHFKGDKKIAFKYRRRKSSQSKIGHRQELTKLQVDKINFKK